MAYTQLEDINATEINELMSYTTLVSPSFWPLVLFGFWIIAMFGSYFSQKRMSGTGDILGSATVASYLTTILTVVMFMIPGVIQLYVLVIVLTITFGITVLFITSKEKL